MNHLIYTYENYEYDIASDFNATQLKKEYLYKELEDFMKKINF